jgi:uncharacterized protein (DUF608 family)
VWSYAQTVAWLFPDLERSCRRIDYLVETEPSGLMRFRTNRTLAGASWSGPPAVDAQMGSLLRLHREWRFSGDTGFLKELWPSAKSALEFAIREWDADGDGLLEARLHNTYDVEFEGPEPLGSIMYLAALRAAARMARSLRDYSSASRFASLADLAAERIDSVLFNGEYYQQRLPNSVERKYQYGAGVLSDQLLGQLHAHLNGLGFVVPEDHACSAIAAVFRHNFRPIIGAHEAFLRAFAVNDEPGLLVASWPHGGRPETPFFYADEVWSGIEYAVAAELVYCGMTDEALAIVRGIRARHTGEYRSPWNESEAGNHYARAMAAWAVLLALSGVQYDAIERSLSFDPVEDGTYFFTAGTGWGTAVITDHRLELHLDHGALSLTTVGLRERTAPGGDLRAGETLVVDL